MVPLKAHIKSEQKYHLSIQGDNKNMHIFHLVPHSNKLPGDTIYNNIYKEKTCYKSYDQMNSTVIYQHLQTAIHCAKTKSRMKNGNIKRHGPILKNS